MSPRPGRPPALADRLALLSVLLVILPALLVNTVNLLAGFQSGLEQTLAHLESVTQLKDTEIEAWRRDLTARLQNLAYRDRSRFEEEARHPQAFTEPRLSRLRAWLQEELSLNPLVKELFVTDERGAVKVSTLAGEEGKILGDQPFFGPTYNQIAVSPPFYWASHQEMSLVAGRPLPRPPGPVHMLYARADLRALSDIALQRVGLGRSGESLLIGANQSLLTRGLGYEPGRFLRDPDLEQILRSRGSGRGLLPALNDSAQVAAWRWIEPLDVLLLTRQDLSEALAPLWSVASINLGLALLLAALALLAARVLVRRLTRPLQELTTLSERFAGGAYGLRLPPTGYDELDRLGASFEALGQALTATIGALETHKLHLEDLVQERTRELEAARDRAEEADRVKSAFLATMSHELRTPLNSIIGFTGILLQGLVGPLNEEQKKQLGFVQTSSRHLLALIGDVLDISKIESGRLNLDWETFAVGPLLEAARLSLSPLAEKKGLSLESRLHEPLPRVRADRRRLQQVLLNLGGNAVKFTEAGRIDLEARPHPEGGLEISVKDTGPGIAAQDLPRLFKPFSQLESGLDRKYEGTGLGLSICKKLIEMMGGRIGVESRPGQGSRFSVRLPAAPEEVPP